MDRKEWLSRYPHVSRGIFPDYEWVKFPEVTLSAPTGTGQMASVPVLKQRTYIGKRPVIPSTLADTPCSDLSIRGLLEKFNIILNTSYTLSTPWVYSVLGDCILKNFDFGTAYAYLRPFWCSNLATMKGP
ncbi:uncharacterized protein ARMOST_19837 [Armillaria ostoyae]|uniref:Uncharacterized protein n=1 Tax=Armillaria ostoyae TaxID=47428 RepID=A0A284S5P5_ARMOS|nr:uncharacterized protein ARMOST_19837 [Armillaria ostoyae]